MSFLLQILDAPDGASHIWTPAVERPVVHSGAVTIHRLKFFRPSADHWDVFSPITGWRRAGNPPEWFAEEAALGYLVTRDQAAHPEFVPVKEIV